MPEDLAVLSGVWDRISAAEELPGSTSALEDGGSLAAGGHISLSSSDSPISLEILGQIYKKVSK